MKAGDRFTLKNGVTLEIRPNLVQILTKQDSCEGCYFNDHSDDCADAGNEQAPACGSAHSNPDEQIIFVEVTKDESG